MKKSGLFVLLLISMVRFIVAQPPAEESYFFWRDKGVASYEAGKFEQAINEFKVAEICVDAPQPNDIDKWLDKAMNGYVAQLQAATALSDSLRQLAEYRSELSRRLARIKGMLSNDPTRAWNYATQLSRVPLADTLVVQPIKINLLEDRQIFYDRWFQVANKLTAIDVAPDGKHMVAAKPYRFPDENAGSATLLILDMEGNILDSLVHKGMPGNYFNMITFSGPMEGADRTFVCFTPDSKYIISVAGGNIMVWDWKNRSLHGEIEGENGEAGFFALWNSGNEYLIQVGTQMFRLDGSLFPQNISLGWEDEWGNTASNPFGNFRSVSIAPDRRLLAEIKGSFGSFNQMVVLKDMVYSGDFPSQDWEEVQFARLFHPANVTGLAMHPSGGFVFTCADDGAIRRWSCKKEQTFQDQSALTFIFQHPQSQDLIGIRSDGSVFFRNPVLNKEVASIPAPAEGIRSTGEVRGAWTGGPGFPIIFMTAAGPLLMDSRSRAVHLIPAVCTNCPYDFFGDRSGRFILYIRSQPTETGPAFHWGVWDRQKAAATPETDGKLKNGDWELSEPQHPDRISLRDLESGEMLRLIKMDFQVNLAFHKLDAANSACPDSGFGDSGRRYFDYVNCELRTLLTHPEAIRSLVRAGEGWLSSDASGTVRFWDPVSTPDFAGSPEMLDLRELETEISAFLEGR